MTDDGRRCLRLFVNDYDAEFLALVQRRGYWKDEPGTRPMYRFDIPDPFPAVALPNGFRLMSLAEEPDWAKVHRVMWRGFNHPGEPPAGQDQLDERRRMFDADDFMYGFDGAAVGGGVGGVGPGVAGAGGAIVAEVAGDHPPAEEGGWPPRSGVG